MRLHSQLLSQKRLLHKRLPSKQAQGFTMVELIISIAIMAILAFGIAQVIINMGTGYQDSAERERAGGTARVVIARISKEIRNALPNSVRTGVSGGHHCVEFVPVLGATNYLTLPTQAPATTFQSVPFFGLGAVGRAAVYPLDAAAVYNLNANSVVSSVVTDAAGTLNGNAAVAVNLTNNHQFPTESPTDRWFMVDTPVSFCLTNGGQIFRYDGYGFSINQLFPGAGLPATLPASLAAGRRLLANNAGTIAASAFTVNSVNLQSNAIVHIDLTFVDNNENVNISHEVQLRNVP